MNFYVLITQKSINSMNTHSCSLPFENKMTEQHILIIPCCLLKSMYVLIAYTLFRHQFQNKHHKAIIILATNFKTYCSHESVLFCISVLSSCRIITTISEEKQLNYSSKY